jgi:hypothetical protein
MGRRKERKYKEIQKGRNRVKKEEINKHRK